MILKKWIIKTPNPQLQVCLSDSLQIHPVVSQLLINRGVKTPQEASDFLDGNPWSLHDPFLLKDMDKAITRLKEAKARKEKVLIFGDYDVDGVTSSAVLAYAFKEFGLDVINHIPHRLIDGYGLNHTIAKEAKEKDVKLLVAVDCIIMSR
ncbi:MAG: DHH family phosphoesterase [Candidatus Omnitrophica bacterium]|nr:DHH family phosphoesterase [Candidatus Omnitrophota bacterium]